MYDRPFLTGPSIATEKLMSFFLIFKIVDCHLFVDRTVRLFIDDYIFTLYILFQVRLSESFQDLSRHVLKPSTSANSPLAASSSPQNATNGLDDNSITDNSVKPKRMYRVVRIVRKFIFK